MVPGGGGWQRRKGAPAPVTVAIETVPSCARPTPVRGGSYRRLHSHHVDTTGQVLESAPFFRYRIEEGPRSNRGIPTRGRRSAGMGKCTGRSVRTQSGRGRRWQQRRPFTSHLRKYEPRHQLQLFKTATRRSTVDTVSRSHLARRPRCRTFPAKADCTQPHIHTRSAPALQELTERQLVSSSSIEWSGQRTRGN